MKILYITNHQQILRQSGGFLNDYLNDLLFYGFTELDEIEIVDSTPIVHLYKENEIKIPTQHLWGKGFSSSYLISFFNFRSKPLPASLRALTKSSLLISNVTFTVLIFYMF
jgi:hypothetical protein